MLLIRFELENRDMYETLMYQGKMLVDWQKEFNFEFSLGELYRMVKDGCDLGTLLLRTNGHITFED